VKVAKVAKVEMQKNYWYWYWAAFTLPRRRTAVVFEYLQ